MEPLINLSSKSDSVEVYFADQIAVMKIKKDIFDEITDLSKNQRFFQFFDIVKRDRKIKMLYVWNEPGAMDEKEYDSFIRKIIDVEHFDCECDLHEYLNKNLRFRQLNFLNRFIKQVVSFNKIFVSGLTGTIVTPFFGTSLAADFRVVSPDMKYSLAHYKYGFHPSGGLVYFLSKYLHHSIASEILFKCKDITAEHALQLGLINKIIPLENFERDSIEYLKQLISVPQITIRNTKRLLNNYRKDLLEHLDYESTILNL